jgi:succinyl-CoA synthetase alpha subunit
VETFLLDKSTRAIVQGITGRVGQTQTHWMLAAGTPLVEGVTPGRGGQVVEGLPVYDTVADVVRKEGVNASVVFVPAKVAWDALIEAIDSGLRLIVVVTEHIPVRDTMELSARARYAGVTVIGPNRPGFLCQESVSSAFCWRGYFAQEHRRGGCGRA